MNNIVGQGNTEPVVPACNNCDIWKQLCKYKDLEEQGRLIELPCKVGEYVWMIKEFGSLLFPKENKTPKVIKTVFLHKHIPLFGYSVFFTKEEAEAKLAELEGGVE